MAKEVNITATETSKGMVIGKVNTEVNEWAAYDGLTVSLEVEINFNMDSVYMYFTVVDNDEVTEVYSKSLGEAGVMVSDIRNVVDIEEIASEDYLKNEKIEKAVLKAIEEIKEEAYLKRDFNEKVIMAFEEKKDEINEEKEQEKNLEINDK